MNGFLIALGFLTRVPVALDSRQQSPAADLQGAQSAPIPSLAQNDLSAAVPWLPFVGGLIGLFVATMALAGTALSPWMAALLGLIAWIGVTGALHLDGLGDVADAYGAAHRSPERFIAVLRDPHAGSFAIVAIGMQLVSKLVLLHDLSGLGWRALAAVTLAAAWARWGVLVWAHKLPPLRTGLGSALAQGIQPRHVWWNASALLVASLVLAPALIAAPLVVWLLLFAWQRGLGAINGDGLGCNIELTESALLVLALVGLRSGLVW